MMAYSAFHELLAPNTKSNCSAGAASFSRLYEPSHRIWSEYAARVLICPDVVKLISPSINTVFVTDDHKGPEGSWIQRK